MIKYLIFLFPVIAQASGPMINVNDLGKIDGVTIYYHNTCPGECYPIDPINQIPEVLMVLNGRLVVDPIKQAARSSRLALEQSARETKAAEIATKEADFKGVGTVNTVPELSQKLESLLFILKEKGIISK